MSRRWPDQTIEQRFWSKVDKSADCWTWQGSLSCGYGKFSVNCRPVSAHRFAYESAHGAIAPGYQVDHTCRQRACVRPDHLRLVTHKQNGEHSNGQALPSNKTSGVRGVFWNKQKGKWQAKVEHHGRTHHVGFFSELADAAEAVRQARIRLFTHNDADRKVVA